MLSINVQTAQNVFIDYPVAGVGDRILAAIIDSFIVYGYLILVYYLLSQVEVEENWVYFLCYLPTLFYHLICEALFHGQSIGKRQLSIKVVRLDGMPPTLGNYILRWILYPIDLTMGCVGLISIAISQNSQRLGDLTAGTTVVKLLKPNEVTHHDIVKTLDNDYKPVFLQVKKLSDHHITLMHEAIRVNKEQANAVPAQAITEKAQMIMGITTDMPPVRFLHTIIKDYTYLTSRG